MGQQSGDNDMDQVLTSSHLIPPSLLWTHKY